MKPYANNPRRISDKQLADLSTWLAELGDLSGIVHDLNSDSIIGGNQRSKVFDVNACEIVLTEQYANPDEQGTVALGYILWQGNKYAYRQVRWNERQAQQANVVANRAGGEWDFELLSSNFVVDDLLMWGFEPVELGIAEPKPEVKDAEPQIDRAEEFRVKWGTATGQLWQLGEHRLICGDCTDAAVVARVMGDDSPNLILADPPYGVNIVATNGYVGGGEGPNGMIPFGGKKNRGYVGGGDRIKASPGLYPIETWSQNKRLGSVGAAKPFGSKDVRGSIGAANIVDVGKYAPVIGDETTDTALKASAFYLEMYPKAVHVWWGANYYTDGLSPSPCWLVWDKETTGNFADCELAWTNQDKAAKLFRHQWNGMLRDSERERRWHPTQKPAALAAWVFGEFTEPGAIILDPFAGAGWSLLGGENTARKVRAIEMSEEYIAIILQRYVDATGVQPELSAEFQMSK